MIRDFLKKALRRNQSDTSNDATEGPDLDALFPLYMIHERVLPDDYSGPVITSDIDRTYLQTSISSMRGLVRTALEGAEDKRAFSGMVPLYQALRKGPDPSAPRATPLYFVSASPPQMEQVLREKMQIDGLEVDGLTFKDQARLVRQGRIRELRKHIVYKLTALLLNRLTRPEDADIQEILLGDDSETDAEAYLLYARILQGALSPKGLAYTLEGMRVRGKEKDTLMHLATRRDQARVARIYIHCTTRKKPQSMLIQDPLVYAARDGLQIALDCLQHGWLSPDALLPIAQELGPTETKASLQDARQRQILDEDFLQEQAKHLNAPFA